MSGLNTGAPGADDIRRTDQAVPLIRRRKKTGTLLMLSGVLVAIILIGTVSVSNTILPRGIVIHHSAVSHTIEGHPVTGGAIAAAHRRRGFGAFYWGRTYHIGYHYLVNASGAAEQGRPERCRGAHAVGFNDYLGICLIGNFEAAKDGVHDVPKAEQLGAAVGITRALMVKYQIPLERVLLHRETNTDTRCPGEGFPWNEFRTALRWHSESLPSSLPRSD